MKLVLPFLETMITQVCNLSCAGCSNYSDLPHKGYVKWEDGKQQLEEWLEVIDIPDFGIMGGEPLINPQVYQWLYGIRELMPHSQIRFTTNGLLLHKHSNLLETLVDIGNVVFKVTLHHETEKLTEYIDNLFKGHKWEEVKEYGITRWKTTNNTRFQLNKPDTFLKTYQGTYETMRPYNSNFEAAFDICCQKTCPLLYNGKIYKCSTAGLLKDTLNMHENPNIEIWKPYIAEGMSPTDVMTQFINNFGKPHYICSQCPSSVHKSSIPHDNTTVTLK